MQRLKFVDHSAQKSLVIESLMQRQFSLILFKESGSDPPTDILRF